MKTLMPYRLFLDDIREVEDVYTNDWSFQVVRSYDEFVAHVKKNGCPAFISFDNDLGLTTDGGVAKEGYDAAKWLVYKSDFDLRHFQFEVHSANPVARKNIIGLLNNYISFLKNQ